MMSYVVPEPAYSLLLMEAIDYFRPTRKWFIYSKEFSAQHSENFKKILRKISRLAYSFQINFQFLSGKILGGTCPLVEDSKIFLRVGMYPHAFPHGLHMCIQTHRILGEWTKHRCLHFADMPGNTTVDQIGQQTVPIVILDLFDS